MTAPSLQRRLVVAIAALTLITIAVVGVMFYAAAKRGAWQQFDDGLRARAQAICAIAEHDEDGYEMEMPPMHGSYATAFLPLNTTPLASSGPPIDPLSSEGYQDRRLPDGRAGRAVQIRCMPRDETGNATPLTLVLAEGTENVTAAIDSVQRWFLLAGLLAVLATIAVAFVLVRRALAPLPQLAHSIAKIDDKSLDQRLSVAGQPAELVAPIDKLNELLGRLSTSFARERQFTADVSHELRTPIAALRTRLEVTQLADRSTEEYKAAVDESHSIVLQLGALVENLLLLARLDAGQIPLATTDVDIHELVADCWKPLAATAAARKLEFRSTIPAALRVAADREKLRSVIANLLANAAEYTEEGGWIEVSSGSDTLVAVTDSGPPIPPDQLPKLFDRMWRGDTARTSTGTHCGIGLALARSLCAAMSLDLSAESRGATVRFSVTRRTIVR